ncbi:MAG: glycosyltransferase family 39 protein [Pyrinomonadaceae bacterium]
MSKDKERSEELTDAEIEVAKEQETASGPGFDYLSISGSLAVGAVAVFLRFWQLGLKPLHHDEGVNGFFLTRLFREGIYQYDPANYHGPDLYYLALAFSKSFGLNTLSVRSSVALFGVLTVVLVLFLRRYIGRTGALVAGLLIALSPGMVYISRYFIHEILFVFFSLGIVLGVLYFIEKRRVGSGGVSIMTLLLLICFLPTALNLAELAGEDRVWLKWALQVSLLAVEFVLVFMIMRMLCAWKAGRPIYLILASASAAMLFATKETAFITIGTMAIAALCVWLWRKIDAGLGRKTYALFGLVQILAVTALGGLAVASREKLYESASWAHRTFAEDTGQPLVFYGMIFLCLLTAASWILFFVRRWQSGEADEESFTEPVDLTWSSFRAGFGGRNDTLLILAAAFFVFAYLGVLFFSSFFTYPYGIVGAFEAYAIWTKTGSADHTQNGFFAYLWWAVQLELPILLLSLLGTLIAFLKSRHRFAMFAGLWAFGLFAAYTIIPYKTPWLALSFLLPMCIIGGYGVNELIASRNILQKAAGILLAATSIALLSFQTCNLNFVRYDDEEMAYIYAHTRRGFLGLIDQINHYAEKSGKRQDATIEIVSPDYWPMPWYTNDYPNAVYGGSLKDVNTAEMIVASQKQADELPQRYGAHYKVAGQYPLRPGVELYLLVRKDLADPDAKEIYQLVE